LNDARETRMAAWRWGVPLILLATLLRLGWVLLVPTVPVGDFATYRESANYLVEFGAFDNGFIYMPGFVVLLAGVQRMGGALLAQKLLGVFFGGLGALGIFGLTSRLVDGYGDDPGDRGGGAPRQGAARWCPCPAAVGATLAYAVWPAGIALSSVVGTDMPAAALIVTSLWLLSRSGARPPGVPWRAALAFGVAMGLAAYVRAVALPLTAMSAGYWLARRRPLRQVVGLTALAGAATLLVLLPWGLRNRREHGALSFTDSHGGITALIGANPNSEGTYTRALNDMFKQLTGRTVIAEPHRETDQLAYALAKDWTGFEVPYAMGLAAMKAERLFGLEQHLLYWPIGRPGVLIGPARGWFALHRTRFDQAADAFWLLFVALYAAGVALAAYDRLWPLLSLLPFQAALAATYIVFFAEIRYRVPIEMMAFPIVAFAARRLFAMAAGVVRGPRWPAMAAAARRIAVAGAAVVLVFVAASAVVDGGARLRVEHRWAATVWSVLGRPSLAKWRRVGPVRGPSPIAGAPNGVRLTLLGGGAAGPVAPVVAEIEGATLPAGRYQLRAQADASDLAPDHPLRLSFAAAGAPAPIADLSLAPAASGDTSAPITATFDHAGGPLRLVARLEGTPPAGATPPSVWLSSFDVQAPAAAAATP
jgi:hypothetical protein